MVLWMHGVVAEELLDVVASPDSTAYDIWTQLHVLFMDNQPGRAVILGAEIRNLVQGDLFIAEYSRRLKSLADALEDVGEHISDQALTLQLICGLNRKFQIMATLLPMQSPFPSFVQARSRLLMKEISANERARLDGRSKLPAVALTIGHAPSGGPSPPLIADQAATPPTRARGPLHLPQATGVVARAGVGAVVVAAAAASRLVALPLDAAPLQPGRSPRLASSLHTAPSSQACLHHGPLGLRQTPLAS
ncbi:uncharacterized protein [Triticum aestivum]|uniref:uncharacterized protein n=1 Tax=Triticum aestivum TaxID=4565 RepID=UPI001D013A55|nr:uncharacterized protein LOC123066654 [Triticum aestivum]